MGALLTLVGAGLLYWTTWLPLQAAWTGSPSVHVIAKGVIVGTVALVAGLLQLVFGPMVLPILHPVAGESKFVAYASATVIVAAGFGAYFALKSYLSSLGYFVP